MTFFRDPANSRRSLREVARDVLQRAKSERSSPPEVGLAVATGVFSACTPFLGFHMWIALGLATVFRLNRLLAFLGSRISILPVYLWISFCELELGHRMRAGDWLRMAPREALSRGRELSLDWLVGTAMVGAVLAAAAGWAAYSFAKRWPTAAVPSVPTAEARVSPRTPAAARLPSSESPPSAPRDSRS